MASRFPMRILDSSLVAWPKSGLKLSR